MKTGTSTDVAAALAEMGHEVLGGKGGFWLRGRGYVSLEQARRMTAIAAPKREPHGRQLPWGDFAAIVAINGRLNG